MKINQEDIENIINDYASMLECKSDKLKEKLSSILSVEEMM